MDLSLSNLEVNNQHQNLHVDTDAVKNVNAEPKVPDRTYIPLGQEEDCVIKHSFVKKVTLPKGNSGSSGRGGISGFSGFSGSASHSGFSGSFGYTGSSGYMGLYRYPDLDVGFKKFKEIKTKINKYKIF